MAAEASGIEASLSLPAFDPEKARRCFPAFATEELRDWAFFENAGGSYACAQVIDRLTRYYTVNKVQPNHAFDASMSSTDLMREGRERLARCLGLPPQDVFFGPSTSANTYMLSRAFGEYLNPGDEIIVTDLDHEANIGAWRRLSELGMVVKCWRVEPDTGSLNPDALGELLTERTRLLAFSHCSNIVGTINPVRRICDIARSMDVLTVVDGVSYCPHGLPNVPGLGADIYLFSLYKVYGPHQGVLCMRQDLATALPNQAHFFNVDEHMLRMNPAGPDHAQLAATAGVVDYLAHIWAQHFESPEDGDKADITPDMTPGMTQDVGALFQQQEQRLMAPLLQFLTERSGVRLIGNTTVEGRAPTIAITAGDHQPDDLCAALARTESCHRIRPFLRLSADGGTGHRSETGCVADVNGPLQHPG